MDTSQPTMNSKKGKMTLTTEERILSTPMTIYERAQVLTERVLQLAEGSPPRCSLYKKEWSYEEIAEQELKERKLDIIIDRKRPSGKIERWNVQELL